MVRFFHIDDVQPIVDIANNQYGIDPPCTADEIATIYGTARAQGHWDTVLNYINANPGQTETEILAGTGLTATERQLLMLLAVMDHLNRVVAA